MVKDFKRIQTRDFAGKRVLACFRFSYPVLVLHLGYMTETANERFGLERFIIEIMDNLSQKSKPFPYDAVSALCGLNAGIISSVVRDLEAQGFIVTAEPNVYKVLETTKRRYLDNMRPRERQDKDFLIDSVSRGTLPLAVYEGMKGFPKINKPSDTLHPVGMTGSEIEKFTLKLNNATERRKRSLGFPPDADEFEIENVTEGLLDEFYVIYSEDKAKGLVRNIYYNDTPIDSAFAESAPFMFGVEYRDGKLTRRSNMSEGHIFALTPDELKEYMIEKLQLKSEGAIQVTNDMVCHLSYNCLDYHQSRDSLFDVLSTGIKEAPIFVNGAMCGSAFFSVKCSDDELEKLLRFYIETRNLRQKEDVMASAARLGLMWRQALVMTGRLKLLEDIDINDFILC